MTEDEQSQLCQKQGSLDEDRQRFSPLAWLCCITELGLPGFNCSFRPEESHHWCWKAARIWQRPSSLRAHVSWRSTDIVCSISPLADRGETLLLRSNLEYYFTLLESWLAKRKKINGKILIYYLNNVFVRGYLYYSIELYNFKTQVFEYLYIYLHYSTPMW